MPTTRTDLAGREKRIADAAKAIALWHSDTAPAIINVAELRRWLQGGGPADTILTDRLTSALDRLDTAADQLPDLVQALRTAIGTIDPGQ